MKVYQLLFALTLSTCIALLSSCDVSCDNTPSVNVGKDQFLTIEYLDTNGVNYLDSIYNTANVQVFIDTVGGDEPFFQPVSPGYENGKFGPFYFADNYVNEITGEVNYLQLYEKTQGMRIIIQKDNFGVDTFGVSFRLAVNNCITYWESIKYFQNGQRKYRYDNQEQVNIVIVE